MEDQLDSDTMGDCDTDRAIGLIRVSRDLRGKLRLDTECHELLHFLFPYLEEDEVRRAGSDLAEYLVQRGFIKKELL